jgi:Fic family protein
VDLETRPVLKRCIEARASLAGLNSACSLLPNPSVLINTIPLLEAQASSEIENIVTTSDALFRYAEIEDQAVDPATKEAFRYRAALREGFQGLRKRPVNTRTAEQICSTIKGTAMEVRRVPGTALTHAVTHKVIYTPPVGEALIRTKLANWEAFVHQDNGLDPLIRMSVAHYQFEAIHPFTDGNGRTGRILNLLHLVEAGLLQMPVLYLSRYIIRHRADYYRLLTAVTARGDWESWILYMLTAVSETTRWTTEKIGAIRQLQSLTRDHLRRVVPKIYSQELLDVIFMQPYVRIQNLVSANIAKRQTASVYLKALAAAGVLEGVKVGLHQMFIHPKLLNLLTRDQNAVTPYI